MNENLIQNGLSQKGNLLAHVNGKKKKYCFKHSLIQELKRCKQIPFSLIPSFILASFMWTLFSGNLFFLSEQDGCTSYNNHRRKKQEERCIFKKFKSSTYPRIMISTEVEHKTLLPPYQLKLERKCMAFPSFHLLNELNGTYSSRKTNYASTKCSRIY